MQKIKKTAKIFGIVTLMLLVVTPGHADKLYKWVDPQGRVIYQDKPPADNTLFEVTSVPDQSSISDDARQKMEEVAREHPVVLYSIPVCDSCDLVRLLLEKQSIPFAEKNVNDSIAVQQELKQKSDQMGVPTLLIGDSVLDGFSRSAIRQTLESKGFPLDSQITPRAQDAAAKGN